MTNDAGLGFAGHAIERLDGQGDLAGLSVKVAGPKFRAD
jgi:hypothetical protein